MNSMLCIILILIVLFIKAIYLNDACYNVLRLSHSKTYIRKNYKGFLNWLFYKDYAKEVKVYFVINIILLLLIGILSVLFLLSFFFDIHRILFIITAGFVVLAFIYVVFIMLKCVIFGETARGKLGPVGRIFVLIILLVIIGSVLSILIEKFTL